MPFPITQQILQYIKLSAPRGGKHNTESFAPSTHRFITSLFSALPDLGPAPPRLSKPRRGPGPRDGGIAAAPRRSLPAALIYRAAGGWSALCQQIVVPAVAPVIHQPAAHFRSAGPLSLRNYRSTQQSRREIIVCLLLSPLKLKEKMRFRLLASDHGVFLPTVLISKSPLLPFSCQTSAGSYQQRSDPRPWVWGISPSAGTALHRGRLR